MTRSPKNARTAKESAARRDRAMRVQVAIIEDRVRFYTGLERARIRQDLEELVAAHAEIARGIAIRSGIFEYEAALSAVRALGKAIDEMLSDE